MSVSYERKATPTFVYERPIKGWHCFRIRAREVDALSGLMFRNEIAEFLLKAQVDHKIGNRVPGFDLPFNEGSSDYFVLVQSGGIETLNHGFPISGYNPVLVS